MNINDFVASLERLSLKITPIQLDQLEQYYHLLVEWNKKMNLTGITEKEEVYLKHFYDSLTIQKAVDLACVNTLCDIGTGAGFPGMVIKILFPKLHVTLVDSLQKRVTFLKEVKNQLHLDHLEIIADRAEQFALTHRDQFDIVTCRAVASLPILLEYALPMVRIGGYFLPMKGNATDEIEKSSLAFKKLNGTLENVIEFTLPIENSARAIIKIKKSAKTPPIYPRPYASIKKNPL